MVWNEYVDAFTFVSETVLGFARYEKMLFLETFRGNTNDAKHPRNNKSRRLSKECFRIKYDQARRSPKISKKTSQN